MSAQSIVTMDLDPTRLTTGFEGFVDALDRNLPIALKAGATVVMTHAKQNHPYTDRTGFLTQSIRPLDPTGTFSEGNLGVDILAGGLFNVDYALCVEKGTEVDGKRRNKPYPFMVPALDTQMPRAVKFIGDAVELSIEESGL